MASEVTSKEELASLATKLDSKTITLKDAVSKINSSLSGISDYDGINVSGKAGILDSNLNNVATDLETVVTNIKTYVSELTGFDVDDFNASGGSSANSVSYDDIFVTDGSAEGNARVIWNFLKAKGLSDAAAAGVLGNIQAECGFNPAAIEGNGEGHGLIQWSFGRRESLLAAAQAKGVDWRDLRFQLEYLWEESLDPNTSYGKQLQQAGFYNTSSPSDAAYYFHRYVEISNDTQEMIANNRCATAESWYSKFQGTSAGDVVGTSSNLSSASWTSLSAAPVVVSYASSGGRSSSSSYTTVSYATASSSANNVLHLTSVNTSSGDPNIDISKYHNNLEMGFEVTAGNLAYEVSDEDFELLCAIVAAESDKSYDDSLAVITTILNRCESPNWIRSHGTDPVAQATAPNQFVVYQHGSYKKYMDGNVPNTVKEAVMDALAGVRNHDYLSFRSNSTTSYSNNMITPTGNRYK